MQDGDISLLLVLLRQCLTEPRLHLGNTLVLQ
jgi:hypothetical protein